MENRLPYYMAYPIPMLYDDDKMERQDFDYMKSMYPEIAKKVLPFVEDECDRMMYEGSMIYDEYPDQLQIRMMCGRIYTKVKDKEGIDEKLLREIVQLIMFQELYRRRCEYRKRRKQFYIR